MSKLLAASTVMLGLTLAIPVFAQPNTSPAAPPAVGASSAAPAKPAHTTKAKPSTATKASASTKASAPSHATARRAPPPGASQDAKVDQLNQQSLQAAQQGRSMTAPMSSGAPSGSAPPAPKQ